MFFDLSCLDKELISMFLMIKRNIEKKNLKEKVNRVKCPLLNFSFLFVLEGC